MAQKPRDAKRFLERKAEEVVERMEKTSGRKLILVLLGIISFSVLTLGYLQIKLQLEKPFFADRLIEDKARIRGPIEFIKFYREQQRNQSELTSLQKQDSDTDGLSDYQEIYIYNTNPYSEDTDADGINDNLEIAQNTNPNCPQDQICDQEGFIVTETEYPEEGSNEFTSDNEALVTPSNNSKVNQDLQSLSEEEKAALKDYFNNLTTDELKSLLREQGFPQEQVDQLSDEVLRKTLNDLFLNL